jgi:hypothetical protein
MIGNVYANAGLRLSGCQYYCNLRRVESSNKVVDENLLTDSRNTQYRCCAIEQEVVSKSLKLSASIHIVANGCIFGWSRSLARKWPYLLRGAYLLSESQVN